MFKFVNGIDKIYRVVMGYRRKWDLNWSKDIIVFIKKVFVFFCVY